MMIVMFVAPAINLVAVEAVGVSYYVYGGDGKVGKEKVKERKRH